MRVMECPTVMNCVIRLRPDDDKVARVHVDCLKHYMGGISTSWHAFEQSQIATDAPQLGAVDDTDTANEPADVESDDLEDMNDLDEEDEVPVEDYVTDNEMNDGMNAGSDDDDVASPGPVVMADMNESSIGADNAVPRQYGRGQRVHKAPVKYSP